MERNTYSKEEAKQRIASQMPLSEKCEKSNFVVENSGNLDETRKQVEKISSYLQTSNHHIGVRFYLGICSIAVCFISGLFFYALYYAFFRIRK